MNWIPVKGGSKPAYLLWCYSFHLRAQLCALSLSPVHHDSPKKANIDPTSHEPPTYYGILFVFVLGQLTNSPWPTPPLHPQKVNIPLPVMIFLPHLILVSGQHDFLCFLRPPPLTKANISYLLWYSSLILFSSPDSTTFCVFSVTSTPSFMYFLILVMVRYWLLLSCNQKWWPL